MPEELSNSQGQLVWQASYRTWGSTVTEEWEIKGLAGQRLHPLDQGDTPQSETEKQQNLRFQGQYLDRETGLHYNTFRYYDPDVGRFICPDPIGLNGGINLGSYSPNPIAWIDPWGLACSPQANKTQGDSGRDKLADRFAKSRRYELINTEVRIKTPATGNWRQADIVVRDRKTGEILQIETKTGNAARNPTQIARDKEIASGNGTTWGSKRIEGQIGQPPSGIKKGDPTGPIRTIEVTVDPSTGKILR